MLFAFSSDGVQPRDLLKHVRKAIDSGLSADAALKALTIDAARILGVDCRLGTLEAGKIANLVVTDGDLFAEKTKVKLTFVDGNKFEATEPARTETTSGRTASLSGRWSLSVDDPRWRAELDRGARPGRRRLAHRNHHVADGDGPDYARVGDWQQLHFRRHHAKRTAERLAQLHRNGRGHQPQGDDDRRQLHG